MFLLARLHSRREFYFTKKDFQHESRILQYEVGRLDRYINTGFVKKIRDRKKAGGDRTFEAFTTTMKTKGMFDFMYRLLAGVELFPTTPKGNRVFTKGFTGRNSYRKMYETINEETIKRNDG